MTVRVGIALNEELLTATPDRRRLLLAQVEAAGLDHLTVGDHLSFHGGVGFDGIVAATAALATSDRLDVVIGVYLAGLRHPLATARALATLSQIAPGRLVFGVGVGGEDRSEIANAGVDPATRGRRLDETLDVLRRLASGEPVDHEGEFFHLSQALVLPPPSPRVPIVVGGAGEVAVRRTAEYGDGWLGMWCSARRYGATHRQVVEAFGERGRGEPTFAGLNVWAGLGADPVQVREALGSRMSALYHLPAEKFQHIAPAGRPEDVAAFLQPFVEAGARTITLSPVADDVHAAIALCGEVRQLLTSTSVPA